MIGVLRALFREPLLQGGDDQRGARDLERDAGREVIVDHVEHDHDGTLRSARTRTRREQPLAQRRRRSDRRRGESQLGHQLAAPQQVGRVGWIEGCHRIHDAPRHPREQQAEDRVDAESLAHAGDLMQVRPI